MFRLLLFGLVCVAALPAQNAASMDAESARRRLIHEELAVYPLLAEKGSIHGVVRISVRVDSKGTVEEAVLISGHPLLTRAALAAVRQYRYRQLILRGRAVPFVTTVNVTFDPPALRRKRPDVQRETLALVANHRDRA